MATSSQCRVPAGAAWAADARDDVRHWLRTLRLEVEEYEDWSLLPSSSDPRGSATSLFSDANKYYSAEEDNLSSLSNHQDEEDEEEEDAYSSAFDDILSSLGREIYRLDSYNLRESCDTVPAPVVEDIMHMFEDYSVKSRSDGAQDEGEEMSLKKVRSFGNISVLSDEVFLKSASSGDSPKLLDVNGIFDRGEGRPVPPRRRNRPSVNNLDVETKPRPISAIEELRFDLTNSMDDSDSGNNSPSSDYQHIWACTSGFKAAQISAISLDSVVEDMPSALEAIAACTEECDPHDECHRSLRQHQNHQNNHQDHLNHHLHKKSDSFVFARGRRPREERLYENLEFLRSRGMIAGGPGVGGGSPAPAPRRLQQEEDTSSVEIVSDSDSWRTPAGRERSQSSASTTDYADSESPIYENVEECLAKNRSGGGSGEVHQERILQLGADVLAWKALLLDPYWNDDEEDEWVSPEEVSEYANEQKPPFVIPKIRQYSPRKLYPDDESQEPSSPSIKDVCKKFEEEIIGRAQLENPKFVRSPNRTALHNNNNHLQERQPYHQHLETSPIVTRKSGDGGLRSNKSKSMITGGGDRKEQMKYFHRVLPFEYNMQVKFEGTLNRAKIIENGKKIKKKNWQREYAIMTETSLIFYKDKKAYDSIKDSPEKASSAIGEIKLHGSLAGKSTIQQTSRSNAIVVTTQDAAQYLIHHEDPQKAQQWLDAIIKAINKLPHDYKCPDNINLSSPLVGTPSPTNKHVSKVKSIKVTEGSVEDLTTDHSEHASVKSTLREFFKRRPTKESLIKNKIYEDEPIFGRKLEDACPLKEPRVPEFVVKCIKVIESSEENMSSDGLYRASGNLSQVQKIRVEVNQNNLSVLEKEPDVNVLTGALKLFFRELKEPLIPYDLFQPCLNASSNPSSEGRIKELRDIVNTLPECNRQTLKFLLEHLLRVTARKEKNRMHIANIAIVLGPTLLQAPPEASQNMAFECLQQNRVIEILMCDYDKIFKEGGKSKK